MNSYIGRFTLGQKTSHNGEPGLLGDEYDLTAFSEDVARDMLVNVNSSHITVRWVQNLSGAALVPGTLVMADVSNDMAVNVRAAGATDTPVGIVDPFLKSNVANGESFLIVTRANRIPARSGAAFVKGARLLPDASGNVVTGAGTAMRAQEAATGAGQMRLISCNFVAQ